MRFELMFVLLAIFAFALTDAGFGKKRRGGLRRYGGGFRRVGYPVYPQQQGYGYPSPRGYPIRNYNSGYSSFYPNRIYHA